MTRKYFAFCAKSYSSEDPKKIDKNKYTTLEDGVTTCCGYDFWTDVSIANYCPICGKKIWKK